MESSFCRKDRSAADTRKPRLHINRRTLGAIVMDQPTLNFNPVPKPGELFEYGSGLYEMYSLLYSGGMTTAQAARFGRTHTRRISDIRARLREKGHPDLTIKGERIQGKKDFFYKIERLETARMMTQ